MTLFRWQVYVIGLVPLRGSDPGSSKPMPLATVIARLIFNLLLWLYDAHRIKLWCKCCVCIGRKTNVSRHGRPLNEWHCAKDVIHVSRTPKIRARKRISIILLAPLTGPTRVEEDLMQYRERYPPVQAGGTMIKLAILMPGMWENKIQSKRFKKWHLITFKLQHLAFATTAEIWVAFWEAAWPLWQLG